MASERRARPSSTPVVTLAFRIRTVLLLPPAGHSGCGTVSQPRAQPVGTDGRWWTRLCEQVSPCPPGAGGAFRCPVMPGADVTTSTRNLVRPRASSLWTQTRTRPEVSQFPPGLCTELGGPDERGNGFCGA